MALPIPMATDRLRMRPYQPADAGAAGAWLTAGFRDLNLPDIIAVSRPENTRSRRVLEMIGLRPRGAGYYCKR